MPAPSTYFKVFGDHKLVSTVKLKRAGAWVNVPRIYTKVAGAWKLVFEQATTPWDGGLSTTFSLNTGGAVCGNDVAIIQLGYLFNWGSNVLGRLTVVDDELVVDTDLSYTTTGFPWGHRASHPFSLASRGEALIAATSSGILVMQDHNGKLVSFNQSGTQVDTDASDANLSNVVTGFNGKVYAVTYGTLSDDRNVTEVAADGTITSLYPEGALASDGSVNIVLFPSNTSYMRVYYPETGALHTLDPDSTGGGFGDGTIASTTIDDGYVSLATAGDGSIFGLKTASTTPTRVYRNDVLVFTGPASSGATVNIMRNWATGGIVLIDQNKLFEISADGTSVETKNIDTGVIVTYTYNQINTHPSFPGTMVGSASGTTGVNPPYPAILFRQ